MSEKDSRWDEIRKIHIEAVTSYRILGGIVLVGFFAWLGKGLLILIGGDGYDTNVYTEILGVVATIVIVNTWYHDRDERRRYRETRYQLLLDICSTEPVIAKHALHQIRRRGWLSGENGLLREQDLRKTQLSETNLDYANLFAADLRGANLEGATLVLANAECADLVSANLKNTKILAASLDKANLFVANLSNSNLSHTSLVEATLIATNFHMAILDNVNLKDALLSQSNFRGAQFNENTILPDGSKWEPGKDLSRYTDPEHPDPFCSDNPKSPAYRGE